MARAAEIYRVRSAIVCTQAYHLPRAVFLARRAGIDAVGLEAGRGLVDTSLRDLVREGFATLRALVDVRTGSLARPR
jgi:SanA protein